MTTPQTEVILRHAGAELARATLPPGEYVIGRDPGAGIYADTPLLSRKHVLLTLREDAMLIEDLGSSNGTFIERQPVAGTSLVFPGQDIRLGDVTLEIVRAENGTGPTMNMASALAEAIPQPPEGLRGDKKYEIGAEVARGGMGAIREAQQTGMDRRVAMKVMLEGAEEVDVARFVNEAKITGQLEHPNIVPVHELGVDAQGKIFYTMKFVRGITLKKVLELLAEGVEATVKKYPLPALLTIFQKACDAVAFAHSKGVIHRDLKPENIMLGDFGEVLVMDWGLAKMVSSPEFQVSSSRTVHAVSPKQETSGSTMAGTVMGTPQYMAPEQARGEIEALDARADIYALGAILYHLLALRPSVGGDDAWTIVTKVARGEIEPLTVFISPSASPSSSPSHSGGEGKGKEKKRGKEFRRIPDSLAAVVRQAMAFDRAQRYARVEDLQADLTAYQSGFATSAEKASLGKQIVLALKRHKVAAAGIAAVLLVGTVFGTHAFMQGRRAERALAELKKSAPAFAAEADSLVLKGDVDGALARLATTIQLDPANPHWHGRQGQILSAAQRFPESAEAFHRAALLDPHQTWGVDHDMAKKVAATRQPDGSHSSALLRELYTRAIRESRTGDALLLAAPLKLAAQDALPLWQGKVNAWLGKNAPKLKLLKNGGYELDLKRLGIADLTPLKGMPLTGLDLGYNQVSDLSSLAGMPLRWLNIERTKVTDLSPLTGIRLTSIALASTPVSDLSPLRGMPIENFTAQTGSLSDISPLSDSPLTGYVRFEGSRVSDLSPLAGKQPFELWLADVPIKDFSVLRGMPMERLHIGNSALSEDLVDIVMSLKRLEMLSISGSVPGFERLRTHPTLKYLGHYNNDSNRYPPVAEYWRAYDKRKTEAQKNAANKINVRTLSDGTKRLQIQDSAVSAIPPLDWTDVSVFVFFGTQINDLSPLRGVRLKAISFFKTPVADLEPLRGSPVVKLAFMETAVTDVGPLLDCPNLEAVSLPRTVKNVEVLRKHPKLRYLGYTEGPGPDYLPETTAEQFWKIYDALQAGKK